MDSSPTNSLQDRLAAYAWPDRPLPRILLEEAAEGPEPKPEDWQPGRAILTPDPPPNADDSGGAPPDPPLPPETPVDRRERPNRPPLWRKLLWWLALILLAYTVGSAIGAWGIDCERKWGWR